MGSPDSVGLLRALIDATRVVAASTGGALDGVLDVVSEQVRGLVGADGVSLHVAVPGTNTLIIRKGNQLSRSGSPHAQAGKVLQSSRFMTEAIATRRALFARDFQGDSRVPASMKADFPTVVSSLAVPLLGPGADLSLVGVMFADWTTERNLHPDELAAIEALASHAAIVISTNRLIEESRAATEQLEAVFEAATDVILLIGASGELLRANGAARGWLASHLGYVPASFSAFREFFRPSRTASEDTDIIGRALAGGASIGDLDLVTADGSRRHLHVSAAPVIEGGQIAAVVIARDITDLRRGIADAARLDGAVKTARRVSHELNNRLSLVVGYGELLTNLVDGPASEMAERVQIGALRASETLHLLQRIIRFEEVEFGGQMMLDLQASTGDADSDAAPGETVG